MGERESSQTFPKYRFNLNSELNVMDDSFSLFCIFARSKFSKSPKILPLVSICAFIKYIEHYFVHLCGFDMNKCL